MQGLVADNRIFKQRNVDIGTISQADAIRWGFSGPCLRASGVAWDLRRSQPYEVYDRMEFDVVVGHHGDCYDRFMVRMGGDAAVDPHHRSNAVRPDARRPPRERRPQGRAARSAAR